MKTETMKKELEVGRFKVFLGLRSWGEEEKVGGG